LSGFVSDGARGGAVSQSLGTWNGPARPAALEGLTALELTGADRTGLLSEVFAVLADMECSVVEARAWTHRGRLACVAFLRGEDADAGRVPRILARLGHLLRGDPAEVPGAVAAVPAAGVAHADRRLHQLMAADRDRDGRAFPTPAVSVDGWAERGYSVVTGCGEWRRRWATGFLFVFFSSMILGLKLKLCE